METIENEVSQHYTHGSLEVAIRAGLNAMGRDQGEVVPEDLVGIDEFHIGGHEATADLAERLELGTGRALLDIGSGLGGPARFFARRCGCRVTGVDLTPEYVEVARTLTQLVGLSDQVEFHVGSALDLPFDDDTFDCATLLHVGMNIPDKERLCAQVYRVLHSGGTFAIYDVMQVGEAEIAFPVPWAAGKATSFLASPQSYRQVLVAAGFEVVSERDRREFGIAFFHRMRERIAERGPPPLGLHVLMGQDAPTKVANMTSNLEEGLIAPIEMICRKP